MSLGYIGYCKKVLEDDTVVFYTYSGADWNNPNRDCNAEMAYDGELSINKNIFEQARTKSKQQTEYIGWAYSAIESGDAIVVRPCKNAFTRGSIKIDYIAHCCFLNIFERVYHDGVFPEKEGFIQ